MSEALLTAFAFRVEILVPGRREPLCDAAFAACEGLELRFEVASLREGGQNSGPRLHPGGVSYGEVTLRRGMTSSFDLWDWCSDVMADPSLRADARIVMLSADGASEQASFLLRRCLPVRLRAPRLDASGAGVVAIEELQLACEALSLERPDRRPDLGTLVKAEFHELDDINAKPINADHDVVVQFNPGSLSHVRTEAGATLSFTLEIHAQAEDDDVRERTERIAYFAGRPGVRFGWGRFRFDGRLTTLEQHFDSFARDGRPLRASLGLTLSGWDPRPRPTRN